MRMRGEDYDSRFYRFGEAASSIALGLRGEGIDRMVCYDAMQDDERMSEIMKERVAACQGEKAESAAAVCPEIGCGDFSGSFQLYGIRC